MRPLLPALIVAAVAVAALSGCAPSHRLAEVSIQQQSVAVMAAIPPESHRVRGPWPFIDQPVEPQTGEARRRFQAARVAQNRLDTAAAFVDVAEIIARRSLLESARALNFRPAGDPDTARFILDVRLIDFGFFARSFEGEVYFSAEADVRLLDGASGEEVWQRRFRERDRVRPDDFLLEEGRRVTPLLMTRLSTDQLAYGLERLAMFAADRVAEVLASDYRRAHR